MRNYDFAPLWRSTIGFDRIFDLLDESQRTLEEHYPPYNIERLGEDHYQISLALAGFTLESRHADWSGAEFTAESRSHVSVYRLAVEG